MKQKQRIVKAWAGLDKYGDITIVKLNRTVAEEYMRGDVFTKIVVPVAILLPKPTHKKKK